MYVLGAAGHVDHGKSTLLRRLTGMEPDRLPEEKKRGMTIELGFVWKDDLGFIDVPGHRKLVRNMVGGAFGIDAFVFVVAADDGWMPQSEEHLTILKGLGITRGIGVVTKTDLVGDARAREVADTVRGKLPGCEVVFAAQAAAALSRLVAALPPPETHGRARLWIDRVFTPKGLGPVLTGTLREGRLRVGQHVEIWPGKKGAVVKTLQIHGKSVEEAAPTTRVAVQLARIKSEEVARGGLLTVATTAPSSSAWVEAEFTNGKSPGRERRLGCLVGTIRREVRVVPLGGRFYRLRFSAALPVRSGDRFLLRAPGEEETVGWGRILDIEPLGVTKARAVELLGGWEDGALGLLQYQARKQTFLDPKRLAAISRFSEESLRAFLTARYFVPLGSGFVTAPDWERLSEFCLAAIPEGGATSEAALARGGPKGSRNLLEKVVRALCLQGKLVKDARGVRRPGARRSSAQELEASRILAELQSAGGQPVCLKDRTEGVVRDLVAEGTLVALGESHFLERARYEALREKVQTWLRAHGHATTSDLKNVLEASRKNAVLVLEKFDRDRMTYLKDGVRRLLRSDA